MTDPSVPPRPPAPHWLVDLATFSGVDSLDLSSEPGPDELIRAWTTITARTGMRPDLLAERVAGHFRLEVADLLAATSPPLKLVPADVARRFCVFPLEVRGDGLLVATADPRNRSAVEALEAHSARHVRFRIAPPRRIQEAIERHYPPDVLVEGLLDNILSGIRPDGLHVLHPEAAAHPSEFELDAPAVARLTDLILDELGRDDVAGVEIAPGRDGGRVRLQHHNGASRHFMHLPVAALTRVALRIKKLAGMDLTQRGRPQTGAIHVQLGDERRELFVATTPGPSGERVAVLEQAPDYGLFLEESQRSMLLAEADPTRGNVLVVDDDASSRLLIRSVLEKLGFDVLEAEDGPPALELLDGSVEVSLVVLDLNMPRLHGSEVLERIRSSVGTAGLPVVVLTAIEDPDTEIALLSAGADDYLRKPIDPERLAVRVRAVLRRAGSYTPLDGP